MRGERRRARSSSIRTTALWVEIEHGVAVAKPLGGKGQAAVPGPVQVGSDLTPAEEAALILGGWQ